MGKFKSVLIRNATYKEIKCALFFLLGFMFSTIIVVSIKIG